MESSMKSSNEKFGVLVYEVLQGHFNIGDYKIDLLRVNNINEITDIIIPKLNYIIEDLKGKNTPFQYLIDKLKLSTELIIKICDIVADSFRYTTGDVSAQAVEAFNAK